MPQRKFEEESNPVFINIGSRRRDAGKSVPSADLSRYFFCFISDDGLARPARRWFDASGPPMG